SYAYLGNVEQLNSDKTPTAGKLSCRKPVIKCPDGYFATRVEALNTNEYKSHPDWYTIAQSASNGCYYPRFKTCSEYFGDGYSTTVTHCKSGYDTKDYELPWSDQLPVNERMCYGSKCLQICPDGYFDDMPPQPEIAYVTAISELGITCYKATGCNTGYYENCGAGCEIDCHTHGDVSCCSCKSNCTPKGCPEYYFTSGTSSIFVDYTSTHAWFNGTASVDWTYYAEGFVNTTCGKYTLKNNYFSAGGPSDAEYVGDGCTITSGHIQLVCQRFICYKSAGQYDYPPSEPFAYIQNKYGCYKTTGCKEGYEQHNERYNYYFDVETETIDTDFDYAANKYNTLTCTKNISCRSPYFSVANKPAKKVATTTYEYGKIDGITKSTPETLSCYTSATCSTYGYKDSCPAGYSGTTISVETDGTPLTCVKDCQKDADFFIDVSTANTDIIPNLKIKGANADLLITATMQYKFGTISGCACQKNLVGDCNLPDKTDVTYFIEYEENASYCINGCEVKPSNYGSSSAVGLNIDGTYIGNVPSDTLRNKYDGSGYGPYDIEITNGIDYEVDYENDETQYCKFLEKLEELDL
ncbi:MAG: hypothetical protein NC218_12250, partial [Acetobacter sp.]|nr:hypothetical protein [Acetobacter sp.]